MVRELAEQGMAILFISSDLPEVLAMSDRILVMREGRQMGILGTGGGHPGGGHVAGHRRAGTDGGRRRRGRDAVRLRAGRLRAEDQGARACWYCSSCWCWSASR